MVQLGGKNVRAAGEDVGARLRRVEGGDVHVQLGGEEGETVMGALAARRVDRPDVQAVGLTSEGESQLDGAVVPWHVDLLVVGEASLSTGVVPKLVDGDEGLSELGDAPNVADEHMVSLARAVGGDDGKISDALDRSLFPSMPDMVSSEARQLMRSAT